MLFLLDFARTCTQSVFICGCKITREIALVARSKTFNERRQGFKEQQHIYDIYIDIYRCIQLYVYIDIYSCICHRICATHKQQLLLLRSLLRSLSCSPSFRKRSQVLADIYTLLPRLASLLASLPPWLCFRFATWTPKWLRAGAIGAHFRTFTLSRASSVDCRALH